MARFFVLLLFLATIWSFTLHGQTYNVHSFNHKSEIGTNFINTIVEDENGYIWIGTEGLGITRFNGKDFKHYNNLFLNNGLNVKHISFDDQENIYVGARNCGFFHCHLDSLEKLQLPQDAQNPSIYYLEKRNDRTVVVNNSEITIFSGGQTIDNIKLPEGVELKIHNELKLPSFTILLTNRGNYVINNYEIIPLDQWLGTEKELANTCVHVFFENNKMTLLTNKGKKSINVFLNDDRVKFFYIDTLQLPTTFSKNEAFTFSDRSNQYSYLITNTGRIFKTDGHTYTELKSNLNEKIKHPTKLLVDRNENLWVSSKIQGVLKWSKSPFTPVNYNDIFRSSDIVFYREIADSVIICSLDNDEATYLGFAEQKSNFHKYNFFINSHIEVDNKNYFGTDKGVYTYKNGKLVPAIPEVKNKKCMITKKDDHSFFVFEQNKGFFIYDIQKGLTYLDNQPEKETNFIFASAKMPGENTYIFGGLRYLHMFKNNVWYDLTQKLENEGLPISYPYMTTDPRGIIWMMSPHSIIGLKSNGELIKITDIDHLKSNLLFSILLDDKKNLILGTSSGIVYLELNDKALPTNSTLFGNRNGYEVYEVNYNSLCSIAEGKYRFASLEGVYTINLEELPNYHTPKAPIVDQIRIANRIINYGNKGSRLKLEGDEEALIQFNVVNPKSDVVYYSYRINHENSGKWTAWSKENSALISNSLGTGVYQIEIRASFNKKTSSPISYVELVVEKPFLKNQTLMFLVIFVLLILNIIYLIRKKSMNVDQIMLSKDLNLHSKFAALLLIFGALAILAIFYTAPFILDNLIYLPVFTGVIGGITLLIGASTLFIKQIRRSPQNPTIIGFLLVLAYNLFGCELSNLHPLYILGVILTLIVTPIVFTKFSQIISICIIVLTSSLYIVYSVEGDVLFSETFFIVDISITLFLVIITTYVRNEALEKLIFTSGVINNEDFLVASFKPNKEIVYLNETFKHLLPKNLEYYINKNISELSVIETFNQHHFNEVVLEKFKDKEMFNISLELNTGELRHFQFVCKIFKNQLQVIIGQDITEKFELEKYYEVIVNNSQDLIYRLDISGHLTFINKQCEKSLGIKSEDILGQFYTSVVHPEWREEVLDFYSHQFKNKIKNTYSEIPILTKNGNTVWLGQHMTAIFKEGDEKVITGYLGMGRNITERKRKDEIINNQNKDIRDSINYAKRIQMNLIPEESKVARFFKESFVYFAPKDIVSGDFYWIERLQKKTILISADCTGHGVPGAFMTLLGINLLNQIILENKILDAGEILNQLDIRLNEALRRNKTEKLNDGMECTVCIIDEENDVLEYAISGSKFLLYQKNGIQEVTGSSSHIGEGHSLSTPFKSVVTSFKEDDVIYLFSDGIVDQFGGEKGKKLKKSRFIKLVDGVKDLDLAKQEKSIKSFMENWMKNEEQTDDICLIAVKRDAANKL